MERNYATQMEAARKGIVTPELEIVAKKEQMTVEELMPLVAQGKVAAEKMVDAARIDQHRGRKRRQAG